MVELTRALIEAASSSSKSNQKSSSEITELALSGKGLHEITLPCELKNLVKLELSKNGIQTLQALSTCQNLKWLSISSNGLRSLKGIESLSNLTVLNASRNKLTSMEEVKGLVQLQALILNDNEIQSVCKLKQLSHLNTLVLSRNPIDAIDKLSIQVPSLIKVSLSDCQLQDLVALKNCSLLKELRLAHNNLSVVPKVLMKNQQLQIMDLGNNRLKRLDDIDVLGHLPSLKNLNLRGNPLCLRESYKVEIVKLLPKLQVLDGQHLQSSHATEQKNRSSQTNMSKSKEYGGHHAVNAERLEQVQKRRKVGKGSTEGVSEDAGSKKATNEDQEKRAFLELILQSGDETLAEVQGRAASKKERPKDSGVVLVSDKRSDKPRKSKHTKGDKTFAPILLQEPNIGEGGVSSWD